MRGEMTLDPYITHTFEGLEGVNASIDALHTGSCLRAVIHIGKNELPALRYSSPILVSLFLGLETLLSLN